MTASRAISQTTVESQPGFAPPARWALLARWQRWRRGRRARREAAARLYRAVVTQARQPAFFTALGVPDTREGRIEMVGLHAILVMRRLGREGREGGELAQALFDLMFADLDRHLREWGVGDLSVGKHVKRAAQSFLARAHALEPALDRGDGPAAAAVLRRNLYVGAPSVPPGAPERIAAYLGAQERVVAGQEAAALLRGEVDFAPFEALEPASPPTEPEGRARR